MRTSRVMLFVITALISSAAPVHADPWGPWSANTDAPALLTPADRERPRNPPESPDVPIAGTPFFWLLKIYQKAISPLDGDRCPMYPTCSQYCVLSIRRHGPVVGIIMTADRLMHEGDEQSLAPSVKVGDRYRYLDPVENNDFWWYKK